MSTTPATKSASRRAASIALNHPGTGRQPVSVQAIQSCAAASTPAFRAEPMLSDWPTMILTGTFGLGAPRFEQLLLHRGSAVDDHHLVGGSRLLCERLNQLVEAVAVVERRDDDRDAAVSGRCAKRDHG